MKKVIEYLIIVVFLLNLVLATIEYINGNTLEAIFNVCIAILVHQISKE